MPAVGYAVGLLRFVRGVVDGAGAQAGLDILAGPEAGNGRKIVRGGGGERLRRVVGGRLEALGVLLEDE